MPRRGKEDWRTIGLAMPDVERWYRFRAGKNVNSADISLRSVMRCLDQFKGKVPSDLLAMKQEELDEYMQDLVDFLLKEEDLYGSSVSKYVNSIKSYLGWHSRELKRPLSIPGADESPVAEAQTIPDQAKIGALFAECDLRTSAMAGLELFAGLRPQVLGKVDASDGLVLGDFPELVLTKTEISFSKVPTIIRVRKNISKTRKAYSTFLGPQGCEYLLEYWGSRRKIKEVLSLKSPAITHLDNPGKGFLHRGNIQDCIRVRMRKVGIASSSYILRSYFDNRITMAESHGIPPLYGEFWMGHKGGMQMKYALRKETLPPDVVEDMRRCYGKALRFLETKKPMESGDAALPMVSIWLQAAGYTEAMLADLHLESKTKEELVALVASPPLAGKKSPGRSQKVVSSDALEAFLLEGWLFKATLPDGRAIVERS